MGLSFDGVLIAATTTGSGLTVQASHDSNWYQRGIKITDTP